MLNLSHEGTYYTRKIKSLLNEIAIIGGLSRTLFYGFLVLVLFFVKPFKDLELAISFQYLREKENLEGESRSSKSNRFQEDIGLLFYLQYFVFKRF